MGALANLRRSAVKCRSAEVACSSQCFKSACTYGSLERRKTNSTDALLPHRLLIYTRTASTRSQQGSIAHVALTTRSALPPESPWTPRPAWERRPRFDERSQAEKGRQGFPQR
jgi:hypothetical protein